MKDLFESHKFDIPDDGFSERIIRRLPERNNMLPQIVMMVFIITGLAITFSLQGVSPLLAQINCLIISIGQLQAPSLTSVIAYLSVLVMIGTIGFSVAHADSR